MKNISLFFAALVAVLFSVTETSAQITPPYYNPANVKITGGSINGVSVGATAPSTGAFTTLSSTGAATLNSAKIGGSSDLFLTRYGAKQLMISGDGVGATTNAGWILGYGGASGFSGVYPSTVTPSATNYTLLSDGSTTYLNGTTLQLATANTVRMAVTSTGAAITGALSSTTGLTNARSTSTVQTDLTLSGALSAVDAGHAMDFIAEGTAYARIAGVTDSSGSAGHVDISAAATIAGAGLTKVARFSNTGLTIAVGKTLQVGSGSGTSAGVIAGYCGTSGYGCIWSTGVTPSTSNYALKAAGTVSILNATAAIYLALNDSGVLSVTSGGIGLTANVNLTKTITAAGTTGNRTINTTSGRVNFAAAATSLVVTNSLVTADSIVHCTVATNDTTMKSAACVPTAGSFTIYGNAAATAETAVAFTVTN